MRSVTEKCGVKFIAEPTEVADNMPAEISSLPPTLNGDLFDLEKKNPPAFTILQKDGLDTNLPLLRLNNSSETSRSETDRLENAKNNLCDRKRISRSNDHLIQANLQSNQVNPLKRETRSRSQDSARSADKVPTIKPSITLSTEDFNEVLNAKLKKLQEQEKEKEEQRKGAKKTHAARKKPFITTVKTGEFLLPPPEVASLLGITTNSNDNDDIDNCPLRSKFKTLASLAKKPEVRHSSHIARCPTALKATVDFTLGMMNATTMAATTTLDDKVKLAKRNDAT